MNVLVVTFLINIVNYNQINVLVFQDIMKKIKCVNRVISLAKNV